MWDKHGAFAKSRLPGGRGGGKAEPKSRLEPGDLLARPVRLLSQWAAAGAFASLAGAPQPHVVGTRGRPRLGNQLELSCTPPAGACLA